LRLATGSFSIDGNVFQPVLEETGTLKMSLDVKSVDRAVFKVQNVDMVFGRAITSVSDALQGATAMLGFAFRNGDGSGPWYYDEKMPGDITAGAVDENRVELNFIADLYAGFVVGELVSDVFPFQQESGPRLPAGDPTDIPPPAAPGTGREPGRLPDTENPGFIPIGGDAKP
jgi:hypothetical protein